MSRTWKRVPATISKARKNDWSMLADLIYLDLSGQEGKATVARLPGGTGFDLDANTSLKGTLFQLAGAYTVARTESANLDVLVGLRYAGFDADTDLSLSGPLPPTLPTVRLSDSVNLLDGIIGVKGQVEWGGDWFSPYYLDIGTGDTEFTWQALAGVGYRWDWGDLILAYRHLSYDMGSDKLCFPLLSGSTAPSLAPDNPNHAPFLPVVFPVCYALVVFHPPARRCAACATPAATLAGAHHQQVAAEAGDLHLHGLRRALAEGDHRNHRTDPDHDPQNGQE